MTLNNRQLEVLREALTTFCELGELEQEKLDAIDEIYHIAVEESKNIYYKYKVMFDDGDIDMELYPDEGDEDFEDYDNTKLNQVKTYAKQFTGARIIKVMEKEIL